jgi:DNA-binding response OmpR family regulator
MSKNNAVILELDPQIAGSYELFLAARGFSVTAASSLAAATRTLVAHPAEVLVIGSLPDTIDASTVAERMRAIVAPKPLVVIVLSPNMDAIGGADLVIPRGAHPRALVDAIRTTLRARPVTAPLATAS